MKAFIVILMASALMLGVLATASIGEESPQTFGIRFWEALANADVQAMERCYAPQVRLLAGSELLKKEWGINPDGDRAKDLDLRREDLLRGYKAMIGKIGPEKWKGVFSKVAKEKVSYTIAEQDDEMFRGVRKRDVVMKIATGPGDDALAFVLRPNSDKSWSVVMEATDY